MVLAKHFLSRLHDLHKQLLSLLPPSLVPVYHCKVGRCRRVLNRARGAEASIRRLVTRFGVPPVSARNLQQALVHGTLLYGAEPTWDGSRKMEGEVQRLTNDMGRASLGVRRTIPFGIVTAESALPPARALLD